MNHCISLEGKVIVVTGGSRGIGRAIVDDLMEHGAKVAFCARELIQADDWNRREGGEQNRVLSFRADVSHEEDVREFFAAVVNAYGRLDGVIHNAGVVYSQLLINTPIEAWDGEIAINLTGAFLVIREALRIFLDQANGGSIVSIGSVAQFGMQADTAYAMSKGGLWGLTRFVAESYRQQHIRANLIAAGYIETAMTDDSPFAFKQACVQASADKRVGQPQDVASVARFLASDDAIAMNGELLFVSGGLHEAPLYR